MITVVTLTKNRPVLLKRAIASVRIQEARLQVKHLIIIDNCLETKEMFQQEFQQSEALHWIYCAVQDEPYQTFRAHRVARLRNIGLSLVESPWVAFLDDDNEWEPNHLATLFHLAIPGKFDAVFSNMQVFVHDGRPFTSEFVPWIMDPIAADNAYTEFLQRGIVSKGSNIVRNVFTDSIKTVDMGEWLFPTELLKTVGFQENYSGEDRWNMLTEDDKLNDALGTLHLNIGTTRLPTLKYYLGGYSNKKNEDRYMQLGL